MLGVSPPLESLVRSHSPNPTALGGLTLAAR